MYYCVIDQTPIMVNLFSRSKTFNFRKKNEESTQKYQQQICMKLNHMWLKMGAVYVKRNKTPRRGPNVLFSCNIYPYTGKS